MKKGLYAAAVLFSVFLMATGVSAAEPDNAQQIGTAVISHGNASLVFPPSFMGHPIAYAFALFGQLTIFIGALVVLSVCVPSIDLHAGRSIKMGKIVRWRSLVNVYRLGWSLMMLAVLLGVSGNLMTYLAWGEVSANTMMTMLTADKVMKGLACFPFAAVVYLIVENDEAQSTQLSLAGIQPDPIISPDADMREHYKTLIIVMIVVLLVTFGKASGLGA